MAEKLMNKLNEIVSKENISNDPEVIKEYSRDLSFTKSISPKVVIYATNPEDVSKIIKLANEMSFAIVPVSSQSGPRFHGDTVPKKENSIILDLSKMNTILRVDTKNRAIMVEPGVTFKDIIPEVEKHGLRLMMPLLPRGSKSVLASALEREPTTIPRYQWDSSDPLLCTEVIFGSGDLFRTGAAAGPGSLEDQIEVGQAQKNPMGPTQFSPFRLLQGAQGTMGIVTWATVKCEYKPTLSKILYVNANLDKLLDLEHQIIKYRLCDEILILNNLNFAALLRKSANEIESLAKGIPEWTLITVLSGRGKMDKDRVEYLEGDIQDIAKNLNLPLKTELKSISNDEVLKILTNYSEDSWKLRLSGGCQDIVFISPLEKVKTFVEFVKNKFPKNLGIYLQPIVQGTSQSCEFDIFYNPTDDAERVKVKDLYLATCSELIRKGAFFNRPYGIITKEVYEHHSPSTSDALRKVKKIFDPNNVLNPGSLCFQEEA